jgi:cyclopropane fatty-acyl-phospholipid synthase-like methyltransferase
MSRDQQPQFSGWDERYQQQAVETMPWFYPELDDDLAQALDALGLRSGSALDLGTGPGTQAIQLTRRGFDVTATDLSEAAIRLAQERAQALGLAIRWQQDDILSSRLIGPFDLIFDRGCFHVLPPEWRQDYISTVAGLLKLGGFFFLKCFSQLQPGTEGPNRFTPAQIQSIFSSRLEVHSVSETVYQGTLDPLPRALFCVMQRTA